MSKINEQDKELTELRKKLQVSENDLSRLNSLKGDLTLLEIQYDSANKQVTDLEQENIRLQREAIEVTEKYK